MSLEELVLFATVVAIWIPAWAANPEGTWTKTAGNAAVNALTLVFLSLSEGREFYNPWKLFRGQYAIGRWGGYNLE